MYKVLIAEDEMLVRLGIKNSIRWSEYGMTVAGDVADGRAAWEWYRREKPDLLITDIRMPDMDGIELIAKIREDDPHTQIVILSCLEDFHLVRSAMALDVAGYILKLTMSEEEMHAVLSKARERLQARAQSRNTLPAYPDVDEVKDRIFKDYLFYGIYSEHEFSERARQLNMSLVPPFCIGIMEIDRYDKLKERFQDEKGYLTKYSLLNMVKEVMGQYVTGEVIHDEGRRYLLVFSSGERFSRTPVQDLFAQIRHSLEVYLNVSVSFAVSGVGNRMDQLKELYREAADVLKLKFVQGSGLYIAGQTGFDESAMERRIERIAAICERLHPQDSSFQHACASRSRAMLADRTDDEQTAKLRFIEFIHWIANTLHADGEDVSRLIMKCSRRIGQAETLDEALDGLHEFGAHLKPFMFKRKEPSKEIAAVVAYIHNHYDRPISLQQAAEHANLSPSYLSTMFKKELHVNFIEYINQFRINKAKELLVGTQLRSYEIAERVGFQETTYFSTTFKKVTGISPNEYRRIWKTEDVTEDETV